MDSRRIARLLEPFLGADFLPGEPAALTDPQVQQISAYIDLLVRWNARMNLSAVRDADGIVTRHFGESLFAARHLFPGNPDRPYQSRLIDVGSGAGFPGLPIKIWSHEVRITLIESNQKKAAFLREVIRRLGLKDATVFSGRAESFPGQAEVVTLRAVERFEAALGVAARLVLPGGRIALLIGRAQVERAHELARDVQWQPATPIPQSLSRVLMIGQMGALTAPGGTVEQRALP